MNNYEEMMIESDVFANARDNFDSLLQKLFKSMENNESDEGSITLKVNLNMVEDWVPNGEGGQQSLFDPDYEENLKGSADLEESNLLPGPSNELPDLNGIPDADFTEADPLDDALNRPITLVDEEITDEEDINAYGGDTEVTSSTDAEDDYEYDE